MTSEPLDFHDSADELAAAGPAGQRLANLQKLYHVPVFALRELLRRHGSGRGFGEMRQAELVAAADKLPSIGEADVEDLYENYRYGGRLAFYLYLLPSGLPQPQAADLQRVLDGLAAVDRPGMEDEVVAGQDYEGETFPNQVVLLDEEQLDGIREIRYRYHTIHHFLNTEEQPDRAFQTRYGFLWLDLELGYVAILSRDERVNHLLTLALSKCLQAIPLPVRLTKELVDKHFSIEKVVRVSHYDPGTGVRQSLSGRDLWQGYEQEILSREQRYVRPSSLYEEEVAVGVMSGLGVTSSKGKIYLTKTLPTSVVRAWGTQRLPELVRDVKEMRADRPDHFSRSLEAINHMRLSPEGRAAILDVVEALLKTEREGLTGVQLQRSALEIYQVLAGKYFTPYLRTQCGHCDETAELCPHCESPHLALGKQGVTCKACGACISDRDSITLRCMNGHVTTVPVAEGFSMAPNHWLQKRLGRIFAEMGHSWDERADYFHIEGHELLRLRKGQVSAGALPAVVQNYIHTYWELPTGEAPAVPAGEQPEERPAGWAGTRYENLDLRLRGSAVAGYTVEAALSDGGSVPPQPFILPTDEAFRRRLEGLGRGPSTGGDIQAVGQALFNALFPPRVRRLWTRASGGVGDVPPASKDAGSVAGKGAGRQTMVGLRLRLRIGPPEMMALPWELLFDDEFIGLRLRFPIVRFLDLPDPPKPLAVRPPLRILVAVSQPKDQRRFDVDAEVTNIRQALAQLGGRVEMEVMDHATREGLLARLRQGHHVLHYIGHAVGDRFDGEEGSLLLEDATGRSDPASAGLLGQMVADSNLRIAMLNACDTSLAGPGDAFGGVAHQLVRAGMPAVVAMQMAIANPSAVAFSREFYGALASGWPVDAAVQEGRRGIMTELGSAWNSHIDWAIPTLHMRAPDGVILGIVA